LERLARVGPAHLVTWGSEGFESSLVPLLVRPGPGPLGRLVGHLARANPQWRSFGPGAPALATFRGPDAYVSPSSYATKARDPRVVPTWNYIVLEARGTVVAHDDEAWVDEVVRALTQRHEAGRPDPWSVDDAPADYLAGMRRAIVGVELVITGLEAKRKLSQNRPADVDGVIAALAGGSPAEQAVAQAMAGDRPAGPVGPEPQLS
jgi:transcriptional regulator